MEAIMKLMLSVHGATPEQIAAGIAAAQAIFEREGCTAEEAADASFEVEGWDIRGFQGDLSDRAAELMGVWEEAQQAAIEACCAGWAKRPSGAYLAWIDPHDSERPSFVNWHQSDDDEAEDEIAIFAVKAEEPLPLETTWTEGEFEIADDERGMMTVTGWTSPIGLGLHREGDRSGRQRWNLTHLNSGYAFLYFNVPMPHEAKELAELVAPTADWNRYEHLRECLREDPMWMPRLVGIKHSLPGDRMEFSNAALNDPTHIVWIANDVAR
jgi:hypothetical protein